MIFYQLWRQGLLGRLDREKLLFFFGLAPGAFLLSRRRPLVRAINWPRALVSANYARALVGWLRYRIELYDGQQG